MQTYECPLNLAALHSCMMVSSSAKISGQIYVNSSPIANNFSCAESLFAKICKPKLLLPNVFKEVIFLFFCQCFLLLSKLLILVITLLSNPRSKPKPALLPKKFQTLLAHCNVLKLPKKEKLCIRMDY